MKRLALANVIIAGSLAVVGSASADHGSNTFIETPLGKISVVDVNLRKAFGADHRCEPDGLSHFVSLLHEQLGRTRPDVLLLQEVTNGNEDACNSIGVVDRLVNELNQYYYPGPGGTPLPIYMKAVSPSNTAADRCSGSAQCERETAIVINGNTMEKSATRGLLEEDSYVTTTYTTNEQNPAHTITSRDHAMACLQEKVRAGDPVGKDPVTVPVASVHFVEWKKLKDNLSIQDGKRTDWSNQVVDALDNLCGEGKQAFSDDSPDARVIGGDFNLRRCEQTGLEVSNCGAGTALNWWTAMHWTNSYKDTVYTNFINNNTLLQGQATHGNTGTQNNDPGGTRIDYIFARGDLCSASAHIEYNPENAQATRWYSDHRYVYATISAAGSPDC